MTAAPRFEMDVSAERATGRLRLGAAVITLAAVAWLVASDPGSFGWAMAVIGALAATAWIAAFRLSLRRYRAADTYFLALDAEALTLAEGAVRHHIEWTEVENVQIDEEKLVISVARRGMSPLQIQPRYQGVSLEELAEAVRDAWLGAGRRERC